MSILVSLWRALPIVDSHSGNVSITRVLAFFFAWKVGNAIDQQHIIPINTLWALIIVLSAAFGKSTFGFLLDKAKTVAPLANPQPPVQ